MCLLRPDGQMGRSGLSGTNISSGSPLGGASSNTDVLPEPVHFRYHQDSYDSNTGQHVQNVDVTADYFAMVICPSL